MHRKKRGFVSKSGNQYSIESNGCAINGVNGLSVEIRANARLTRLFTTTGAHQRPIHSNTHSMYGKPWE